MTAATPAPERGSPGTPDGRTYSGPADAATPGQAARAELEATFRREYALHPNDFKAKFEQARDAVMGAADAYAQAVAQADLLERLRAVLLDLRTNPTEARIQALHLIDADDPAERADVLRMRREMAREAGDDSPGSAAREPHAQPAPGLAAAMAEARKVRAVLTEVLGWFGDNGSGRYARVSGTILARAYAKAGLTVPEELRRYQ